MEILCSDEAACDSEKESCEVKINPFEIFCPDEAACDGEKESCEVKINLFEIFCPDEAACDGERDFGSQPLPLHSPGNQRSLHFSKSVSM